MVLYDPERKWSPRAICRPEDAHLFFADGGTPSTPPGPRTKKKWDQAKDICEMCPVIAECRRDTLGEEYGVFGGRDQYERAQIRSRLTRAVSRWPEERRLRWAEEVYRLRKDEGKLWREIQVMTGLPRAASEKLFAIWAERLEEKGVKGEVVDLALPEPETDAEKAKQPFPDRPGRRHAWVRHRGLFSDAWYRGQTPDGRWICVTTQAGHGQVHKWMAAEDVQLYRPQAVVILNYIGRPADEHDLTA
jgi:hypothetical protein